MREWKLRGYLTPEDFVGTDTEKLQMALDQAAALDIRKVIVRDVYHVEQPLIIPDHMHLVLDGGEIHGDLQNAVSENYSFERDRIYIQANKGRIVGSITLCHTRHVVLEDLEIDGEVQLGFCRDSRIEHTRISGCLTLGRGTANVIVQDLQANAVRVTARKPELDCGREPLIRNIALRRSKINQGVTLLAAEDCGLLNIQVDQICAAGTAVTIGEPGTQLPAEQYLNLTISELDAPEPVCAHNPYKHAFIR